MPGSIFMHNIFREDHGDMPYCALAPLMEPKIEYIDCKGGLLRRNGEEAWKLKSFKKWLNYSNSVRVFKSFRNFRDKRNFRRRINHTTIGAISAKQTL